MKDERTGKHMKLFSTWGSGPARTRIIIALAVLMLAFSLLACAGDGCSSANDGTAYAAQCH